MKIAQFVSCLVVLILCSCASTIKSSKGSATGGTYALSSEQAEEVIIQAMKKHFTKGITRVSSPHPGLTARFAYLLDYLDITLMMVEKEKGYSFEIRTQGTAVVTGNIKATNLLRAVEKLAEAKEKSN